MKKTHVVGLLLWRGGLLLAATYVVFQLLKGVLRFTDPILESGIILLIAGLAFVLISLVLERIADARAERSADP